MLQPIDDCCCRWSFDFTFWFHSIGFFLRKRKRKKCLTHLSLLCLIHPSALSVFPDFEPQTSRKFPQKYGPPIYILGENDINCDRCEPLLPSSVLSRNMKFYLLIRKDNENAKTPSIPPPPPSFVSHFFHFDDGDDVDDDVGVDGHVKTLQMRQKSFNARKKTWWKFCRVPFLS